MNERCPIHSTAAMDVVHTNELQCVLLQAKARIAELEDALLKAQPLLQDIMDIHRDPEDGEYHECDTDPCAWCTEAKELLQQKGEV